MEIDDVLSNEMIKLCLRVFPPPLIEIQARLVVGAANNQLSTPEDADTLHARGILYLPDYVANGGGIINVAAEILQITDSGPWVAERLDAMQATMAKILTRAEGASGIAPPCA